MRTSIGTAVLLLALASFARAILFEADVIQALGKYGNKVNALAKYSPVTCGGAAKAGLDVAARDLVYGSFSQKYIKYYRTAGMTPLNFTLGGSFSLGGPAVLLKNGTVFLEQLVGFYQLIFGFVFSQPNHWLYSTPTVSINYADPEFGYIPTATLEVENESRAFVCTPDGRKFQMYFNTFKHVFCYENNPGLANDGWKICGFFEDNKGIFNQPASDYNQQWPIA